MSAAEAKERSVDTPDQRLRPHPSTRLTGPVVLLDLPELVRTLQSEPHHATAGHRQAGLVHRGPLRILLFTFEPGGRLPDHRAPGQVVIQCLRGELAVGAEGTMHRLTPGQVVVLEPSVAHDVEARVESDMLLTVCMG